MFYAFKIDGVGHCVEYDGKTVSNYFIYRDGVKQDASIEDFNKLPQVYLDALVEKINAA